MPLRWIVLGVAALAAVATAAPLQYTDVESMAPLPPADVAGISGVRHGVAKWPGLEYAPDLFHGTSLVAPADAAEVVRLMETVETETYELNLDQVDDATSFEYHLSGDSGDDDDEKEKSTRGRIREVLHRYLKGTLQPAINALYAGDGRPIVPCHSFIRKYSEGERLKLGEHFDLTAYVTAVVSLNYEGDNYTGGLYLSTGDPSTHRYFHFGAGDGVFHKSDLMHGVQIVRCRDDPDGCAEHPARYGTRWSWLTWYKPDDCASKPSSWPSPPATFANRLNGTQHPLQAYLHYTRLHGELTAEGAEQEGASWESAAETTLEAGEVQQLLRQAAAGGFSIAQYELGETLRHKCAKVTDQADPVVAESKLWLEKAVSAGLSLALPGLGEWYADRGDDDQAVKTFDRGCELGQMDACAMLAEAYADGIGVAENETRAVELLLRADSPETLLDAYKLTLDPAHLQLAAEYGNQEAQFRLGNMLQKKGQAEQAVVWWHRAAMNFHKPSQRVLKKMGVDFEYPTGELGTDEGTEL